MSNDVFKIVSAIDGVKNSINKGYSVHDELVYSPVDLDRVLSFGVLHKSISISSIPGDYHINATLAEYLEKEGFVKMANSKEGHAFMLTEKGYTFKSYGGFTTLQQKEERKKQSMKQEKQLWTLLSKTLSSLYSITSNLDAMPFMSTTTLIICVTTITVAHTMTIALYPNESRNFSNFPIIILINTLI